MLRPRTVLDLGARSCSLLDTRTLTQNESIDELLLISVYGIYLGLQFMKRRRWIFTLQMKYGEPSISKHGFHGGGTSLPCEGASFSVYSFYYYSFFSHWSFGLQLGLAICLPNHEIRTKASTDKHIVMTGSLPCWGWDDNPGEEIFPVQKLLYKT